MSSDQSKLGIAETTSTVASNLQYSAVFTNVSRLDADIANGTVEIAEAELAAGTVELNWEYRLDDKLVAEGSDQQLKQELNDGTLTLDDWHAKNPSWMNTVHLELSVRLGPGISEVNVDHGNGELTYQGNAEGTFDLGNGVLELAGEPVGELEINLGNGQVNADWLLACGDTSISLGNGQAEIALRPGSNIEISSDVGIGGIELPQGCTVNRNFLSCEGSGTIGTGEYSLSVDIGNGQVVVK